MNTTEVVPSTPPSGPLVIGGQLEQLSRTMPFVQFATSRPKPAVAGVLVAGVGGDGCMLIEQMQEQCDDALDFVALDTDNMSLERLRMTNKILLGSDAGDKIGTGGDRAKGKAAAEEALEEWQKLVRDYGMVLIVAGMGGGTASGAAGYLALLARQAGALTIAIVSSPFEYECQQKAENAALGIAELEKSADSIIVLPNDRIFSQDTKITYYDALRRRDQYLIDIVLGMTDLVFLPAKMKIDFGSIKTVIEGGGTMVVATAEASGENRVDELVESLMNNGIVDHPPMSSARALLLVTTIGYNVTAYDGLKVKSRITATVHPNAKVFCSTRLVENPSDGISATLIATHFDVEVKSNADTMEFNKIFTIEQINSADLTHGVHVPAYKRIKLECKEQ
ncbi:hypothetical protein J7M28_06175 [bacterium]|nr:hypothetical protein [bacterium]